MPKPGFLQEVTRHHVFRVGASYAVVGWLIIQVVAILFPLLRIPDWLARTLVVLVLAGFPFALVIAWALHMPGDAPNGSVGSRRRSLGIGISLGTVGVMIAVMAGVVWWYTGPTAHTLREKQPNGEPPRGVPLAAGSSGVRPAAATTALNPKSIAVLPLAILGGSPDERYLGDGISEELLNALSRIPGLEVIGRTSSFRFRNSKLGAQAIGRELGVRNLLSGVVQRSGSQLRIDVDLEDAVTGDTLWSERYDEKMESLFALEDKISNAVVASLQVTLGDIDSRKLVFEGNVSARAHDLYLQGTLLSWHTEEVNLNQALELFKQAISEDPGYAAAWAGMARTYINLADVYRAPLDVLPDMRNAADKAVALNPELAEGHLQLGYITMSYDLDYSTARRELELAVKLRPSLAEAHATLALYLLRVVRDSAAARRELQTAEKLDPLNPWYPRWEAYAAIAQHDESAAMELAQRVNRIDPDFAYNGDAVAMVDGAFGHWQACVDRYTMGHAPVSLSSPQFAICQAHAGDAKQATALAEKLEADARHHYVDRTYIAAIYAALGDKDHAMAELQQAYKDHSSHMTSLWLNSWYESLHDDPHFATLIARIAAGGREEQSASSSHGR